MGGFALLLSLAGLGVWSRWPAWVLWTVLVGIWATFTGVHLLFFAADHPLRDLIGGSLVAWLGLGAAAGLLNGRFLMRGRLGLLRAM